MQGQRLAHYEVQARLGRGAMGEVYRATDTNLKRQAGIKVLPASVAGDADRLAGFQREAEVLAALNHPNIAQIYGLERFQEKTSGIFSAGAGAEKIPDVFSCALVGHAVARETSVAWGAQRVLEPVESTGRLVGG